jgi:hypothetical protein
MPEVYARRRSASAPDDGRTEPSRAPNGTRVWADARLVLTGWPVPAGAERPSDFSRRAASGGVASQTGGRGGPAHVGGSESRTATSRRRRITWGESDLHRRALSLCPRRPAEARGAPVRTSKRARPDADLLGFSQPELREAGQLRPDHARREHDARSTTASCALRHEQPRDVNERDDDRAKQPIHDRRSEGERNRKAPVGPKRGGVRARSCLTDPHARRDRIVVAVCGAAVPTAEGTPTNTFFGSPGQPDQTPLPLPEQPINGRDCAGAMRGPRRRPE